MDLLLKLGRLMYSLGQHSILSGSCMFEGKALDEEIREQITTLRIMATHERIGTTKNLSGTQIKKLEEVVRNVIKGRIELQDDGSMRLKLEDCDKGLPPGKYEVRLDPGADFQGRISNVVVLSTE